MRDVIEQVLGWGVVVGIVAAVILGKRRGQESRAAAIAQAHAQGFAEGGQAAAIAHAQQSVTVAVDNSRRGGLGELGVDHSCSDPWACVVCAPVLARIARQSVSRDHNSGDDYDGRGNDDHELSASHTRTHYDGRGYYFDDTGTLGVPVRSVVPIERGDSSRNGGAGGDGVHGAA